MGLPLTLPASASNDDSIKLGILRSLSGTMAIGESALKGTVLRLIADQSRQGGLLGRKLAPVVVDRAAGAAW
jgi:urea transport system substrate-binding protein